LVNPISIVNGRIIPDSSMLVSEATKSRLSSYILREGDVVVARRGEIGRCAVVGPGESGWICGTGSFFVRPLSGIDSRFLANLLRAEPYRGRLEAAATGTTMKNLSNTTLGDLIISVPPLADQHRIVGILQEAFDGIATAKAKIERIIQKNKLLFASHLDTVLTTSGHECIERPLAALCDRTRVITYGVVLLGDSVSEGVPCLRTSNVRWLRIDTQGMKRIAPAVSAQFGRTVLNGGEVLVNVRGTLGGVSVITAEMAGWNVSRELAVVPVDPLRVSPEFVAYWVASDTSQQWLGRAKKGATYVGINIEDLRRLPVNVPPPGMQREVVQRLDSFRAETQRLESIYHQKLAALDALKKSLLHQAFTGNL
jgi:type I restriction enzyme, S subunit